MCVRARTRQCHSLSFFLILYRRCQFQENFSKTTINSFNRSLFQREINATHMFPFSFSFSFFFLFLFVDIDFPYTYYTYILTKIFRCFLDQLCNKKNGRSKNFRCSVCFQGRCFESIIDPDRFEMSGYRDHCLQNVSVVVVVRFIMKTKTRKA